MLIPTNRLLTGRGSLKNPANRFDSQTYESVEDWFESPQTKECLPLETKLHLDASRSIINRHDSKDLPFQQSINPYRGCEHGCIYCYARPSHAYLGFSPGIDFESQIVYKKDAARLLEAELGKPTYRCQSIVLGSNTDVYQPIERTLLLTRSILEVLSAWNHPVSLITKSDLVLRDLDVLSSLAERNLVMVCISLTTLSGALARKLEPRASTPKKRLSAIAALASAGIKTTVLTSPIIPGLNDHELEALMEAAKEAGAQHAHYSTIRLPYELKDLFTDWLKQHFPDRAEKVLHLIQSIHRNKMYDHAPFDRMKGTGIYADLLKQRFQLAQKRLGFGLERWHLDTHQFRAPQKATPQLFLF